MIVRFQLNEYIELFIECFMELYVGNLPSYLADDYRLIADAREQRLRSTENRACEITRSHSSFGDRAFAAAGPGLWNSLPSHLRDVDLSYSPFRQSLKTFYRATLCVAHSLGS